MLASPLTGTPDLVMSYCSLLHSWSSRMRHASHSRVPVLLLSLMPPLQ